MKKSGKKEVASGDVAKKQGTLASKLAEVDPDFCEFLKTEDQDLLDVDLGEVEGDSENEDLRKEEEIGEEEEEDSGDEIVPLSSDEESEHETEEDEEALPDKILKSKGEKGATDEGERTLKMAQIHDWSKILTKVMSGEANGKTARHVIDQIVAVLRCVADKIKPAEKGDKDPSSGKKKSKQDEKDGEELGDEDEEDEMDKKQSKKRKANEAFSQLFDFVGVREFHAVVKLCVSQLIPSFLAVLRGSGQGDEKKQLIQQAHQLRSSSSWTRLKLSLRVYIETLVDLVKYTSDESVATELLAHLNTEDAQIVVFALPSTRRALVQTIVGIWSKGCLLSSTELLGQCHALILTTVRNCPPAKVSILYERIFRHLYRAFTSACKFNPKSGADEKTAQLVASMRSQLANYVLVAPVPAMAHTLAFVRIRQLCAQLRAALSATSTETRARSTKVVLSWPFVRCIDLWTEVVSTSPEGHAVRQLAYPLTQLTIGTARLQPSPRYYPLRLHCVKFLNRLALATNTFIPTLSLILDVFSITDFNAAATSKKSDDARVASLSNLLHFSESQLREPGVDGGMLDSVVNDLFYNGASETLSVYAHRIAFPELSLPLLVRLKKFIKVCHVPRFVEKMKVLLSKVEENSRWIEERRRSANDLHPANTTAVKAWENEARSANPPMLQFFNRVKSTMSIVGKSRNRVKQEAFSGRKRKSPVKLEQSDYEKKPTFRKFQRKGQQFAKRVKRETL